MATTGNDPKHQPRISRRALFWRSGFGTTFAVALWITAAPMLSTVYFWLADDSLLSLFRPSPQLAVFLAALVIPPVYWIARWRRAREAVRKAYETTYDMRPATPSERRMYRAPTFVVLALLVAILGFMIPESARMFQRVRLSVQSLDWPSTEGMVVSAGVKTLRRGGSRSSVQFEQRAIATYAFTVAGREYSSETIRALVNDYMWASQPLPRYTPGDKVVVYYDPANPNRAVLQQGFITSELTTTVFGACFALLVCVLLAAVAWSFLSVKTIPRAFNPGTTPARGRGKRDGDGTALSP